MNRLTFVSIIIVCFIVFNTLSLCCADSTPKIKKKVILKEGDLGSKSNPVKCDGIEGEKEYLERLKCISGKPSKYRRISHVVSPSDNHILDIFEIQSKDGSTKTQIYMDSYWPGYLETQGIKGFKIKPLKSLKQLQYRFETEPLTLNEVYQMIISNGFYCQIPTGNNLHEEALKGINLKGALLFPSKRIILVEQKDNGYIESWSRANFKSSNAVSKDIRLFWLPQLTDSTFENAVSLVENYNNQRKAGFSEWRIPSITELFSIIDQSYIHFPIEFNIPQGKSFSFWTSTPFKSKKNTSGKKKKLKEYYVVNCDYSKSDDTYTLSFHPLNPAEKKPVKAYLLPVFSERLYTYQPQLNNQTAPVTIIPTPIISPPPMTIPQNPSVQLPPGSTQQSGSGSATGNGKTDRIPGFDDDPASLQPKAQTQNPAPSLPPPVTLPPSTPPSPTTSKTSSDKIPGFDDDSTQGNFTPNRSGSFKIVLFPYMIKGFSPTQEMVLNNLNTKIERALKRFSLQLSSNNNMALAILKKDPYQKSDVNDINHFYNIMDDTKPSESVKLQNIRTQIMNSQKIDIIITVQVKEDLSDGTNTVTPFLISGLDNRIYSASFKQKQINASELIQYITETLEKIL